MARPDRLLARAFADSCAPVGESPEKKGDRLFVQYEVLVPLLRQAAEDCVAEQHRRCAREPDYLPMYIEHDWDRADLAIGATVH
jgi:hypothetical protein